MVQQVPSVCSCCRTPQQVRVIRTDDRGDVPGPCDTCLSHRGGDAANALRRAQDHEQVLHTWYVSARKTAAQADEKMKAAFASRDHVIEIFKQLAALHEQVGLGGCRCGTRSCRTRDLLNQDWVRARIRDLERREREEEFRDHGIFKPPRLRTDPRW